MKEASSGVPGFRFAGLPCGIKKTGAPDLALLVADAVAPCAGVFTTNRVVAAPVVQSREKLSTQGKARAVIINSGNANACTGARGAEDARRMAEAAAAQLGCSADEVLVCSTGVIGATLPIERIEAALPDAVARLSSDGLADFAEAIRTTDTQRKMRRSTFGWDGRDYHLAGAVKGAGMIHPNMATMLAFLVTDAPVAPDELFGVWYRVCHRTFNAITIDGDTSTNDTALLFAGALGEPLTGDGLAALEHALGELARELALDIIRDAEGGTKTVAISVTGAASLADAAAAAEAIALSPLVKTALHGEDPNWGRIIAAAGRSGASFHPDGLRLWIGDTLLYADGQWQGPVAEAEAHDVMQTVEYGIRLDLGSGRAHRTLYTCDLSADYVRINADYRS